MNMLTQTWLKIQRKTVTKTDLWIGLILIFFGTVWAMRGVLPVQFLVTHAALAVGTAMVLDSIILKLKKRPFRFFDSALITGLFIAVILQPDGQRWWLPVVVAAIAILSKHLFFSHMRPVFNPAAFGLVCAVFIFHGFTSWWGVAHPVMLLVGVWMALKMRRLKMVGVFLLVWVVLSLIFDYLMPLQAGVPLLNDFWLFVFSAPLLFFAFLMLIEPRTSPWSPKVLLWYAGFVSVVAFAFVHFGLAEAFLPALLLGNLIFSLKQFYFTKSAVVQPPVQPKSV